MYDLSPPAGTHLILSSPGRYSMDEVSKSGHHPPGTPLVKEAQLWGLLAIKRHLAAGLGGRADARRERL